MSLVARHLEEHGMPTVILGSALDIVDRCGAPRFFFTDFPLGNPCGRPWDREMQHEILGMTLDLLEGAKAPRTTTWAPHRWVEGDSDETWRKGYLRLDRAKREELQRAGERRRASQQRAKQDGSARSD